MHDSSKRIHRVRAFAPSLLTAYCRLEKSSRERNRQCTLFVRVVRAFEHGEILAAQVVSRAEGAVVELSSRALSVLSVQLTCR